MLKSALFAAAALTAGPALALSCVPADPVRAFQNAAERAERFIMVLGEIDRIGADLPVEDQGELSGDLGRQAYSFPARFTGHAAAMEGFVLSFAVDLHVEVSCLSAWCGTPPLGNAALLFLRQDADGYVFESRPCSPFAYVAPTEADLAQVMECLTGVACRPAR